MSEPLGERMATLEAHFASLEERFGSMESKVNAMHSLLIQAKGARWIVAATIFIVGTLATVAYHMASLLHMR